MSVATDLPHSQADVVFFISTLSAGGAERTVSTLSQFIDPLINREILLMGTEEKIVYPFSGKLSFLDRTPKLTTFNMLLQIIPRSIRLYNLKKDKKQPVFISLLEYPNLLNLLTAFKGKTVVSVRNHMSTKNQRGVEALFWNMILKSLYNRADKIVAVSEDIAEDLVSTYHIQKSKIQVIYNYYDLTKIDQLRQAEIDLAWEPVFQKPVIITMGRLIPQKGQGRLIRAFHVLARSFPDLQLALIGTGPSEESLRNMVQTYGIADRVHFLGYQENPFAYLNKARFFVLPSIHEGFPNALVEAMACELPVIASDCHSGPKEILDPVQSQTRDCRLNPIDDLAGLLYPADTKDCLNPSVPISESENELIKHMEKMASHFELQAQYGQKARQRALDFDLQNSGSQWEKLIKSLLGDH